MRHRYVDITLYSLSSSSSEKTDSSVVSHFRWDSIKKFLYVAHAFSSTSTNFDMFSKVLAINAHIFEYILYAIFIGVSYMFMDFFIKQYVRRLDTNKLLNPLLRGVSFGILMQTALWTLLHASDLADSIRFFLSSVQQSPSWSKCQKPINITCISSQDMLMYCQARQIVDLKHTSAHYNYIKMFSNIDRNSTSMRFFVIGTVWICNFFIATMTDNALLKLFKFSFLWGIFSTLFILIFLIFSTEFYIQQAFYELMDIKDFFHFDSDLSNKTRTKVTVDEYGCIKASDHHEVAEYTIRGESLDFLKPRSGTSGNSTRSSENWDNSHGNQSVSERLQQRRELEHVSVAKEKLTNSKSSNHSSVNISNKYP